MKKKKIFSKIYKIYVALLFVIMIFCIVSVYRILIDFEKNQPEAYLKDTLSSMSDDKITSLFNRNEKYESSDDFIKNIRAFYKSKDCIIKKEDNLVYGIYLKDKQLLKVTLRSVKHVNKIGIISYDILDTEKIEKGKNNNFYSYVISVPSNYEVLLNDSILSGGEKTQISGFLDGYDYAKIPVVYKYEINNLTKKPKIVIKENGKEIDFKYGNNIDLSNNYKTYNSLSEAGVNFDVMKFSENWSLYLTNDLTGPLHGLNNITPYLIKDTSMYKKAYQWGNSIDVTFTSKHTLKNPPFTNESVSNVIVYNDNAVSCDVKLDKNMIVAGKTKVDTFNSTIYLIKYNSEWKVINIKGVTNK